MSESLPDHTHVWRYERTDEDWFDGDETDIYKCTVDGCGATDRRYIPR